MNLHPDQLVGLLVATSFAAGLNVYATLATLGLLAHAGVLPFRPLCTFWRTGGLFLQVP